MILEKTEHKTISVKDDKGVDIPLNVWITLMMLLVFSIATETDGGALNA